MVKHRQRNTAKIKSSLKLSTIEGSWWAVMYGALESYFSVFYEYLKFSSYEISLLITFPVFVGSVLQVSIKKFYDFIKSRKLLIVILKGIQCSTLPFIYYTGISSSNYYLILFFVCVYYVCAFGIAPPLTSWLGYLVPSRIRGRFFGNKSQIIRIFMLLSSLLAGTILHEYETNLVIGFGIIFSIGIIANLISAFMLAKKYEPSHESIDEGKEKFDIKESKFRNLRNFILFDSFSSFSFSMSGPLMMVYWLRDLNFNYMEIAILINVGLLISSFSLRYWGVKIDELGTYFAIRWTSLFISVLPFFWIGLYYMPTKLILPACILTQSLALLLFSGRELAVENRLFEHMKGKSMIAISSKRVLYKGIAIFAAGLIGGAITEIDQSNVLNLFTINSSIHIVLVVVSIIRFIIWGKYFSTKRCLI